MYDLKPAGVLFNKETQYSGGTYQNPISFSRDLFLLLMQLLENDQAIMWIHPEIL